MKVGRNDPCPCGTGKKFKKCHLNRNENFSSSFVPIINRSIKERNLLLLSAIIDICGLLKGKTWDDFRREISGDHIKELYRVFAWIWPIDTDIISLLPKPFKNLRGFYIGDTRSDLILTNIVRYSLYTDEILVVNPFIHPRTIAPKFNPLINPEQYKQDSVEMIYFVLKLAPWINAGIVNLIPNPADFDYKLRLSVWRMAEERWKKMDLQITKGGLKEIEPDAKNRHARFLWRLPKEYLTKVMKEAMPKISEEEVAKTLAYIDQKRRSDPLQSINLCKMAEKCGL